MDVLSEVETRRWDRPFSQQTQNQAIDALESGQILYFPHLAFDVKEDELRFFSSAIINQKAKNISLDPRNRRISGSACEGSDCDALQEMVARYSRSAEKLVASLLPEYAPATVARTSFRPLEVEGRALSKRKDDSRLHVDAFPSQPTRGQRILRVFTNTNRFDEPRVWHVGEPFEKFAYKHLPRVGRQAPGSSWLQHKLGITKSRRSAYDHIMLALHNGAKMDDGYQTRAPKKRLAFPPGSTWMVYTDYVLHAALGGQNLFEQTFHPHVADMRTPSYSPLRVLENMAGRDLV